MSEINAVSATKNSLIVSFKYSILAVRHVPAGNRPSEGSVPTLEIDNGQERLEVQRYAKLGSEMRIPRSKNCWDFLIFSITTIIFSAALKQIRFITDNRIKIYRRFGDTIIMSLTRPF